MDAPHDLGPAVNRIKRAQGQLSGVLRMIEQGRELDDVVHQLKAVTRALERAGFALVSGDLRRQVGDGSAVTQDDLDKLEKYFLSLS